MDRARQLLLNAQTLEIFQVMDWLTEWYDKTKPGENKERLFKALMIVTQAQITLKNQAYEIQQLTEFISQDRLRISEANHESSSLRAENQRLRESIDSLL